MYNYSRRRGRISFLTFPLSYCLTHCMTRRARRGEPPQTTPTADRNNEVDELSQRALPSESVDIFLYDARKLLNAVKCIPPSLCLLSPLNSTCNSRIEKKKNKGGPVPGSTGTRMSSDLFSFGRITVGGEKGEKRDVSQHQQDSRNKREKKRGRGWGEKKKRTSVLELPRLMILGQPSRSFSRRVHSKQ